MRKALLFFLMFLMVMPGLACGPFLGANQAKAASSPMMGMAGCAGMGMDEGAIKTVPDTGTHVFFKDCAKINLFNVDQADMKAPSSGGKVFFTASTPAIPDCRAALSERGAFHDPPPDWPSLSETRPHLLLTVPRIRV